MRSVSVFLLFSVNFIIRTRIVLSLPQFTIAHHHENLHLLSKRGYFDAASTAEELAKARNLLRPPKPLLVDTLEKTQSQQIQSAGKTLDGESLSTIHNPETSETVGSFISKGHEKTNPKVVDDSRTILNADTIKLGDGKAGLSIKIPGSKKAPFYESFFRPSKYSSEERSMKHCFPVTKDACTFTGVFSGFKKFASKSSKWLRPKSPEFKHVGLLSPLPKRRTPLPTPTEDDLYYSRSMLAASRNTFQRAKTF